MNISTFMPCVPSGFMTQLKKKQLEPSLWYLSMTITNLGYVPLTQTQGTKGGTLIRDLIRGLGVYLGAIWGLLNEGGSFWKHARR